MRFASLFHSRRVWEHVRLTVFLALLSACFLTGGGARIDVFGLLFLHPFAVLCALALLLTPGPFRIEAMRVPALLLSALALLISIQLIPLPEGVWAALPGRDFYAAILREAGIPVGWRPLTLTPDLTLASLVSLVTPAAVIVGYAALSPEQARLALPVLIGFVLLSAFLGLLQLAGGERSVLYFYEITNRGSPVGLMANRNHQAMLLVTALPMLSIWVGRTHSPLSRRLRMGFAAGAAVLILVLLVTGGSRAGLLLAPIGLAFAWLQLRSDQARLNERREVLGRVAHAALRLGPVAIAVAAIGALLVLARASAIDRLMSQDLAQDMRARAFPTILDIVGDFMPLGSGFGSFDPLYRVYEPDALLNTTYLNHAHNDLLELAMTGGLPALILLGVLLVWLARLSWQLWERRKETAERAAFARLGAAIVLVLLLGSLLDYPLRTPLLSALFALALCWMAELQNSTQHAPAR